MLRTRTKLTPQHHGRRMALADFENAQWDEDHLYELARGVVIVSEVPGYRHLRIVSGIRKPLVLYQAEHPGEIHEILGTMECKVLVPGLKSERHPALAVFKRPPRKKKKRLWLDWVPELVVEVVSPGSEDRDYVEKRQEYLARGIQEYWIVDSLRQRILVLRRVRGRWDEVELIAGQTLQTKLLPGFELDLAELFAQVGELA